MDKSRRLESLARLFLSEPMCSQSPQFVVEHRQQLLGGPSVSSFNPQQNLSDFGHTSTIKLEKIMTRL
jgi:hypothetical protein